MLKLSKLFRILKVVRSLKFIADIANFNPGMARLVASLCCLMLVCHWTACFWYIVAYNEIRSAPHPVCRGDSIPGHGVRRAPPLLVRTAPNPEGW